MTRPSADKLFTSVSLAHREPIIKPLIRLDFGKLSKMIKPKKRKSNG